MSLNITLLSMGVSGIKIKFMILLIKLTNLPTFIGLDELVIRFLYKTLKGVLHFCEGSNNELDHFNYNLDASQCYISISTILALCYFPQIRHFHIYYSHACRMHIIYCMFGLVQFILEKQSFFYQLPERAFGKRKKRKILFP